MRDINEPPADYLSRKPRADTDPESQALEKAIRQSPLTFQGHFININKSLLMIHVLGTLAAFGVTPEEYRPDLKIGEKGFKGLFSISMNNRRRICMKILSEGDPYLQAQCETFHCDIICVKNYATESGKAFIQQLGGYLNVSARTDIALRTNDLLRLAINAVKTWKFENETHKSSKESQSLMDSLANTMNLSPK